MKHKKTLALLLAVVTVLTLMVGAMAFFTDRIDANVEAQAGTLILELSDKNVSKSADFKPGEGIAISFKLTNNGNKSADVREVLVLTSGVALNPANTEFDLYKAEDVTLVDGKVTAIASGAQPVALRSVSADNKQITYAIDEFILNGTGAGAEIEAGITSNAKTSNYVLVFRSHAGNAFQNISVKLDYEAQAKQHRNTNADTWTTVQSETIDFAGNDAYLAVPERN